jgi:hypothetical protein
VEKVRIDEFAIGRELGGEDILAYGQTKAQPKKESSLECGTLRDNQEKAEYDSEHSADAA